ncbi:hypothetical protein [Absidia glauca]|uniref:Uncharacterized protein n=1 Tax=Absidia glauca TaxID=4829 RepID=A0A168LL96_ABSGL|nr:hypothetical protein [Absidia glauca]
MQLPLLIEIPMYCTLLQPHLLISLAVCGMDWAPSTTALMVTTATTDPPSLSTATGEKAGLNVQNEWYLKNGVFIDEDIKKMTGLLPKRGSVSTQPWFYTRFVSIFSELNGQPAFKYDKDMDVLCIYCIIPKNMDLDVEWVHERHNKS